MKTMHSNSSILKLLMYIVLVATIILIEGCGGSGYEVNETNGRVYVQRKCWWERMFFGP